MNEFKFACPVCGQHMMCDASHGGSVMECPTCFQKVVAPQAPAPDAKFILTGTVYAEKKVPKNLASAAHLFKSSGRKTFPFWLFFLILLMLAAAGVYFFGGKWWGRRYDWTSADVGKVQVSGAFHLTRGKLTLTGAGADIWDQADAFHYVYVILAGNGEITGRVLNLQNTDPWAKAGVMFRESLDDHAKFAMAVVTPSSGVSFQVRHDTGGRASAVVVTPNLTAPQWFRLKREGNKFTAEASADGATWTPMGSTDIVMARKIFVGLAVCSHHEGSLCRAQFDHVAIQGNIESTLTGTNNAPGKAASVAPPADDTNWTMNLDQVTIPSSTVVGRIHGHNFILERAILTHNGLTLRRGQHGPVELGVSINFDGASARSLAGRTLNIVPGAARTARVTLRWRDANGALQKKNFHDNYALRLEFGKIGRGRLPGKIYLCTPDFQKSYLMGKFTAAIVRPKPRTQ